MTKICVFAGTTEGRELIEFLSTQPVSVTACVATEYGQELLPESENLTVSAKRLPVAEIEAMLRDEGFALVIDATHPYAESITKSIERACIATDTAYQRLLRTASQTAKDAVYVENAEQAAEFLCGTQGNILLTTGSKELWRFASIPDFSARVYARVLPMEASLAACAAAGVSVSHIIAMQGPFSEEMNVAQLHAAQAQWLVTKDGGSAGGFDAKISAAAKTNTRVLVIGRPPQRAGISLSETIDLLCARFALRQKPKVSIVGIGPGSDDAMTAEARRAIDRADCLIGAKRMLSAARARAKTTCEAISPHEIARCIRENRACRRFAVLMSGDSGFFSGTKKLLPALADCEVTVLAGLSSLSYLCARLKTSYEDVFVTSLHGRNHDIVSDVRAHARVFALVGGEDGVKSLCVALCAAGLGGVTVHVGERLSYPDEKLTSGSAAELCERSFAPLSAALIENARPDAILTHGLADEAFLRGAGDGGVVPMTKSEVRAVCLSKLRLRDHAVCWDVGAGTGSVAIETAIRAKHGKIYAIEYKPAALALLEKNKAHFGAENLTIVAGKAPDCCHELPAPEFAFVGGSTGNMRAILTLLLEKNPAVRIVATAISLETAAELTACMKELPFSETEVISMQIACGKQLGGYNMMMGQNPIYIFTMQGGGNER